MNSDTESGENRTDTRVQKTRDMGNKRIVVQFKNLVNGNTKIMVLPDNHHTAVAVLKLFARSERVSLRAIDIQVSPADKKRDVT